MSSNMTTSWFKQCIREPLVHFLAIGGVFFLLFELVTPADWQTDERRVLVDEQALLSYMQYRSRIFDVEQFKQHLADMNEAERQQLIEGYVREEVLFREAKKLGMDRDDYVIRNRLIKKLDSVAEDFSRQIVDPDVAQLEVFYQKNRQDYFVEPTATFTHIFFEADKRGWQEARQAAEQQLKAFSGAAPSFSEAVTYGDRFPFHLNYVERTQAFVQSHFGEAFAAELFNASVQQGWVGPFQSAYGYHLILEKQRSDGHYPALADIVEKVTEEFRRHQAMALKNEAVKTLQQNYHIDIRLPKESS